MSSIFDDYESSVQVEETVQYNEEDLQIMKQIDDEALIEQMEYDADFDVPPYVNIKE